VNPVIKVVLVEDHSLCRCGLADLLRERGQIDVCAATGDTDKVADLLLEYQPNLVVMDLRMPGEDGLTVLRRLRAANIDTPALILTMSDDQEDLAAALQFGVVGYLLKDMDPEDVIAAIGRAARGELVVAQSLMLKLTQMLNSERPATTSGDLLALLTKREHQILEHIVRGESNKVIARALDISPDTVKLHVRHILAKLNLSSRVEAAVFAVEARGTAK
jgi:two-component system nitrate/nitrite response regulator NarL